MELIVGTITNVLISSSMYILVALGLAFVFNMLGILNLAHGAIYMIGGYICYEFAAGLGLNSWEALLITTVILAVFGVFIEKYCFRPFIGNFNAAVTICVALTVVLQTTVNILIGTAQVATPTFAQGVFKLGLISVTNERIATFAVGIILVVLVLWFVNKTKWGQQMQAIAQDREAAYLQGINVHRISGLACAMGCGLAAVAGSLMGAYMNLSPFMGDFMLVKALVLVILGGLGSIGGVVIAGLVLGGIGAILPVLIDPLTAEAITIGVIVILLLFRPQGFFGREVEAEAALERSTDLGETQISVETVDRRKWTKPAAYGGLVVIVGLLPLVVSSPYMLHILILTFIYIVVTASFHTISVSGQFPLAHAAFMGIGAYLAGMASKWLEWPPWVTIPLGAFASAGMGMLIGYPFARLRVLYYALGSLFFGIAVINVIVAVTKWTGGWTGLVGIQPIIATTSRVPYYYFFLGLAVFSLSALYRFEFSRIGTHLKAIAQSYLVASSVGINEARYRILALGVGCFFVGLAGAAYAHYNMVLSTSSFNFMATLWIVMYALIGGIDSFPGAIVGTAVLIIIPEVFRSLQTYTPFISAALLAIVVYLMPHGLVSLPQKIMGRFEHRKKMGVSNAARN